jgi:hypothetical protein
MERSLVFRMRQKIAKILAPKVFQEREDLNKRLQWAIDFTPRPMVLIAKAYFGMKPLVGAEIGVASGDNALSILKILPMKKLFLIDPYLKTDTNPYLKAWGSEKLTRAESEAKRKLAKFSSIEWLNITSDAAAKRVGSNLDFVYVDGVHSFEGVKSDFELYYPLLNEDGIIGGHDYQKGEEPLMNAVNMVARQLDRQVFNVPYPPDWWVFKNGLIKPT